VQHIANIDHLYMLLERIVLKLINFNNLIIKTKMKYLFERNDILISEYNKLQLLYTYVNKT